MSWVRGAKNSARAYLATPELWRLTWLCTLRCHRITGIWALKANLATWSTNIFLITCAHDIMITSAFEFPPNLKRALQDLDIVERQLPYGGANYRYALIYIHVCRYIYTYIAMAIAVCHTQGLFRKEGSLQDYIVHVIACYYSSPCTSRWGCTCTCTYKTLVSQRTWSRIVKGYSNWERQDLPF